MTLRLPLEYLPDIGIGRHPPKNREREAPAPHPCQILLCYAGHVVSLFFSSIRFDPQGRGNELATTGRFAGGKAIRLGVRGGVIAGARKALSVRKALPVRPKPRGFVSRMRVFFGRFRTARRSSHGVNPDGGEPGPPRIAKGIIHGAKCPPEEVLLGSTACSGGIRPKVRPRPHSRVMKKAIIAVGVLGVLIFWGDTVLEGLVHLLEIFLETLELITERLLEGLLALTPHEAQAVTAWVGFGVLVFVLITGVRKLTSWGQRLRGRARLWWEEEKPRLAARGSSIGWPLGVALLLLLVVALLAL